MNTITANKFDTYCPLFPGFYGTIFEYDNEEQDIESYNEEYKTDFDYEDFIWDYAGYHNRVSKAFVNRLESELNYYLPVKIEFQELCSPKYYNFSNDSINVSIEVDLLKLIELIKERTDKATEYFKDKYTSCSGFISFHSNDIEDWLNMDYILQDSKHRIGSLLDCLCSIEIDKEDIWYWCDSESYIDYTQKEQD